MSHDEPMTVADLIHSWSQHETWRDVEGFPGYSVSSWGQIKGPRGHVLVQSNNTTGGYAFVSLSYADGTTTKKVHPLVARAFLGPPPFEGAEVAHNDGNRANNAISNLRWATRVENHADKERHNTKPFGEKIFGVKLRAEDIPAIRRELSAGKRYAEIAERYGVSKDTIALIYRNKIWRSVPLEPERHA